MEMEPEEMASDTRKQENARIREQKTKEAERGAPPPLTGLSIPWGWDSNATGNGAFRERVLV